MRRALGILLILVVLVVECYVVDSFAGGVYTRKVWECFGNIVRGVVSRGIYFKVIVVVGMMGAFLGKKKAALEFYGLCLFTVLFGYVCLSVCTCLIVWGCCLLRAKGWR